MKLKRRQIDPTDCTLVEYAYGRTGSILKAARVVSFMVQYAAARESFGHDLTAEQYAEYWGMSNATAYRHFADFAQVFGHRDVGRVLDQVAEQKVGVQDRLDLTGLVPA